MNLETMTKFQDISVQQYLYSFVLAETHMLGQSKNISPCRGEIMKHMKLTKKSRHETTHIEVRLCLRSQRKNHQFITCHHEIQGDVWPLHGILFSVWPLKTNLVTSIVQLQSI